MEQPDVASPELHSSGNQSEDKCVELYSNQCDIQKLPSDGNQSDMKDPKIHETGNQSDITSTMIHRTGNQSTADSANTHGLNNQFDIQCPETSSFGNQSDIKCPETDDVGNQSDIKVFQTHVSQTGTEEPQTQVFSHHDDNQVSEMPSTDNQYAIKGQQIQNPGKQSDDKDSQAHTVQCDITLPQSNCNTHDLIGPQTNADQCDIHGPNTHDKQSHMEVSQSQKSQSDLNSSRVLASSTMTHAGQALMPFVRSPSKSDIQGPLAQINYTQLYGNLFTQLKQLKEKYQLSVPELLAVIDRKFNADISKGTENPDFLVVTLIKAYEVSIRLGERAQMWHRKLKHLHRQLRNYNLLQHNFVASILCHDLYTTYMSRHKLGRACECLEIVKYAQQNMATSLWNAELSTRQALVSLKMAYLYPTARRQFYEEAQESYRLAREFWVQHSGSLCDGSSNYSLAYHTAHMVEIQLDLPTPGLLAAFLRTKTLLENAKICDLGRDDVSTADEMMQSAHRYADKCTGQYTYVRFYTGIAQIYLLMRKTQVELLNRNYAKGHQLALDALSTYEKWNGQYFSDINVITVVLRDQIQPVLMELVQRNNHQYREETLVANSLPESEHESLPSDDSRAVAQRETHMKAQDSIKQRNNNKKHRGLKKANSSSESCTTTDDAH